VPSRLKLVRTSGFSRKGEVLLGPKDLKLAERHLMDVRVRVFTDPTTEGGMRTAIVPTKGYQDYPGLGWQIAARKPVAVIYAPASRLVWQILAIGGAAVVVAWFCCRHGGKAVAEIVATA
jgi:hypothetical protein